METTSVFGLIKNKYGGFPVNKSGRLALLRWKGKVRAAQERIVQPFVQHSARLAILPVSDLPRHASGAVRS